MPETIRLRFIGFRVILSLVPTIGQNPFFGPVWISDSGSTLVQQPGTCEFASQRQNEKSEIRKNSDVRDSVREYIIPYSDFERKIRSLRSARPQRGVVPHTHKNNVASDLALAQALSLASSDIFSGRDI
jgi:hypothetical protein